MWASEGTVVEAGCVGNNHRVCGKHKTSSHSISFPRFSPLLPRPRNIFSFFHRQLLIESPGSLCERRGLNAVAGNEGKKALVEWANREIERALNGNDTEVLRAPAKIHLLEHSHGLLGEVGLVKQKRKHLQDLEPKIQSPPKNKKPNKKTPKLSQVFFARFSYQITKWVFSALGMSSNLDIGQQLYADVAQETAWNRLGGELQKLAYKTRAMFIRYIPLPTISRLTFICPGKGFVYWAKSHIITFLSCSVHVFPFIFPRKATGFSALLATVLRSYRQNSQSVGIHVLSRFLPLSIHRKAVMCKYQVHFSTSSPINIGCTAAWPPDMAEWWKQ